ncbi:MAG TPA: 16S rRNA (cytosine(1402)-N(4))-methyltransferase, partial [Rhodothermales bacterium]
KTTRELAEVVRRAVPEREALKSLSRVFQAIRIAVNRELEVLEHALEDAVDLLRENGRIAVISYHSLEDRRVKRFLRYGNFEGTPERDLYGNRKTPWREVTRHPIRPDEIEIERNPRARSARLRIAERTGD